PGPQAGLRGRSRGAARRGDRDHQLRGRTDVSALRLRAARRHDGACIDRGSSAATSPGHWLIGAAAPSRLQQKTEKPARRPSLNNLSLVITMCHGAYVPARIRESLATWSEELCVASSILALGTERVSSETRES